jgi:hypothetical protein
MYPTLFEKAFARSVCLSRPLDRWLDEWGRPVALVLNYSIPAACAFTVQGCRGLILPVGPSGNIVYVERLPEVAHTVWGHCPFVYGHPHSRAHIGTGIISTRLGDRSKYSTAPRMIEALDHYVYPR